MAKKIILLALALLLVLSTIIYINISENKDSISFSTEDDSTWTPMKEFIQIDNSIGEVYRPEKSSNCNKK